jgi:hypothetical protein
MNSTDIYTVLLSREYPITGRDYPLLGFSYQLQRENGEVKLVEFGHPTRIVLWDKDGPELADLTEEQVKERIEQVLSK